MAKNHGMIDPFVEKLVKKKMYYRMDYPLTATMPVFLSSLKFLLT